MDEVARQAVSRFKVRHRNAESLADAAQVTARGDGVVGSLDRSIGLGAPTPVIDDVMRKRFSLSVLQSKEAELAEIERIPTQHSYSLAVAAGDSIFLGLHRGSGDDFTTQFDDTFRCVEKTLAEFGLTLAQLVKVNVWLKHIEDLPEMEKRFCTYFERDRFPARMTSTTDFIDDDCLLMIDGVAYRKNDN